jgi:hypothetical protein
MPTLSKSDTLSKVIDPALYARGWKEDFIKLEETVGAAYDRRTSSEIKLT